MNLVLIAVSSDYRWFLDLEFWSLVTFACLVAIIARFAVGPILSGLKSRQSAIEDQLHEIEEAQKEIRDLRDQQEQKKRLLRQQAQEMVAEARRDAVQLREEMVARADEEITKLKDRAKREIELARRKATHALSERATDLALEVAKKKLASELAGNDHDRLIGHAIGAMNNAGGRS